MKNYGMVYDAPERTWSIGTTEYETPAFTYKHVAVLTFIALVVLAIWH